MEQIIKCKCGCGKELTETDKYGRKREFISGHNRRKYDDPTQYKREWNHRNRVSRRAYKKLYHRTRKVKCIVYKGGKCERCPLLYNGKNAAVFHFHHEDRKTKLFAVGNQVLNKSWERIIKELNKCSMLCANCHEMEHSGEF